MTPNDNERPADNVEPPVDLSQLLAASNDDPDLLEELVKLYFDQAREIMSGLEQGMRESAASDVDYLAHKLVGASLACGMSAMVAPLRELEKRGRAGNLDGAEGFLTEAASRLVLVRAAVDDHLRNSKNQRGGE